MRLLGVSTRPLSITTPPFSHSFLSVFFNASSKIVVAYTISLGCAFDWVAPRREGYETGVFWTFLTSFPPFLKGTLVCILNTSINGRK